MTRKAFHWKNQFKESLKARLIVASLILAAVEWFLLGILLFGRFFEKELLVLEEFIQSTGFQWGLRIIVIGIVVILIRKNEWLVRVLGNQKAKIGLCIYSIVGFMGWLCGIIDLLL